MKTLQKKYLPIIEKFKNRASLDKIERKLYSHDIASIPSLIKKIFKNPIADLVVQPENEEEIVFLVKWAKENNIPVVPRGKATSGYGGVIPIKRGIVIDFYRMKKIINIDPEKELVTCQPGITWEQLDKELLKHGLTLRLYPTSYPSSTVGGWFAQGGAGIGSYEYGYFGENVKAIKAILPDGTVKKIEEDELDLFYEAEGITGIITEITLKVKPYEKIEVNTFATPDIEKLKSFIEEIIKMDLKIWSLSFINPRMAELKNKAPLNENKKEEKILLPAAYILTIAYRKKDKEEVLNNLKSLANKYEIKILSEEIARHEWENRFKIMVIKRLGPSLVPSEFIIPLENLDKCLKEIENKINKPVVKEAVIIKTGKYGKPEVVVLGFIPSDERKFSYNFVFGLVLTILKIAEKYGGRPYSTGLYFSKKAKKILGEDKVKKLRKFKIEKDPKNLFNPGKVITDGFMSKILTLSEIFEPFIRPFGNYVTLRIGEKPDRDIRGIPADIAFFSYVCSQCGYCVEDCTQFYGRGWESQSPRGKWFFLREFMEGRENFNQKMVDSFLACTTCERCNLRCSANLPIEESWMELRGKLVDEEKKMTFPPFEMMAQALSKEGNIWAGYRKNRAEWFPQDLKEKYYKKEKAPYVYFAGCTASYVEQDIGIGTVRLLDSAGIDFTYLGDEENCCATPMLVAGKWDLFKETMKKNIKAVKDREAKFVITSCPACDMMWRKVYPEWAKKLGIEYDIKVKHYSEVITEKIKKGEFKFENSKDKKIKVTFHDSCHIGRASGIYEEPRELIKANPNVEFVEMKHNRENSLCCGSVLTLIKEPDVAAETGEIRLKEAIEVGAQKVLALCPCCEFQLRVTKEKKNLPLEIVDLARFTAESLGYELPDPNPEVKRGWAVFEKMIKLMTPEGFATLMEEMFPDIINAMPLGMGKIMKFMGKIPLSLYAMKPMFPILFPILMPVIMPKVMPRMLELVKEKIDMPDYMEEQMPELMPKIVDNLMPHMLKDVIPLVSDPLIEYLKN
ncbi:MAG: FAD-binding and (Fe-S)-binding domain-containing protein [candidate division WOR-3 bacterium]